MASSFLGDFRLGHLPALYFAFAHTSPTLLILRDGGSPAGVMRLYGFPAAVADDPAAAPAWHAGHGRTVMLGLLMLYFYGTRSYAACDAVLAGSAVLGVNDYFVMTRYGTAGWAWLRLLGSLAFAATGVLGWTQG